MAEVRVHRHFYHEDGYSMFLEDIGGQLQDYTVPQPKR
jgi:hypothetical protein